MTKGWTTSLLALAIAACAYAQSSGTITMVTIRGNKYISNDAIMASIGSLQGKPYLQGRLLQDEQSIKDLGLFKDVKVLSRQLNETDWEIVIEVVENPYIKEVRITGNTVFTTKDLLPLVTQKTEAIFNLRTIEPTASAIAAFYEKKGYFAQADIAPAVDSSGTLNVQIIERAVNNIVLKGLVHTRPSVVRRLIKTKPGEAFNEIRWQSDLRRLLTTQWFQDIVPNAEATDQIGKFDLVMDMKEQRTGQIGFGAALDPRSRLAGNLRYADTNFGGRGQSIGLTLQQDTSGGGLSASADFTNPYIDSRETSASLRVFTRVNNYFTGSGLNSDSPDDNRFDERRTGGQIALSRPFQKVYSASMGLSYEKIETLKLRATGQDFIQQDGDISTFLFQVARDTRDVPLDPQEGDYARLTVEPAFTNITKIGGNIANISSALGRHKFLRTTAEYKAFFSKRPKDRRKLGDPRDVIAVRVRAGMVAGTVPFFEQYFAGGTDTVRGYSDQRFWGKRTLTGTLEYRKPLQRNITVAGFVDIGSAWGGYGSINDFTQSTKASLHLGYGVGVAFRTPLGPIRVDFGWNPKGQNRTHFSIGGGF